MRRKASTPSSPSARRSGGAAESWPGRVLIDSHCHLDAAEFDADREQVVARACSSGVERIVVPAVEARSFESAARMRDRYACVRVAFGIHPLYADRARPEADLAALDQRLARGGAVAVGEIGLDRYLAEPEFGLQQALFHEQLKLARKHDLPVLLHVRRAVDEVLKALRRLPVAGGIAHAFNGSRQQADQFIAMGFKLGYGGAMTYPGSNRIRSLARELPLSSMVLESDAPDMAPSWAARQRNEPSNLRRYAEVLAELRACTVEEIIEATGHNCHACMTGL